MFTYVVAISILSLNRFRLVRLGEFVLRSAVYITFFSSSTSLFTKEQGKYEKMHLHVN